MISALTMAAAAMVGRALERGKRDMTMMFATHTPCGEISRRSRG
jgi:hypothetical protein